MSNQALEQEPQVGGSGPNFNNDYDSESLWSIGAAKYCSSSTPDQKASVSEC